MKTLFLSTLLLLAGCQATTPATPVPPPRRTASEMRPVPAATVDHGRNELEAKVRQQAQYIEALLSQNEALKSGTTLQPATASTVSAAVVPAPATSPATPVVTSEDQALAPNAEGVIDLTATTAKPGESVNPFAVRTQTDGAAREVMLHVSGLIAGPSACAVINERLVQAGDAVESLRVERVEAEAVLLRCGERRLRLPLSEKPVRVRLPN